MFTGGLSTKRYWRDATRQVTKVNHSRSRFHSSMPHRLYHCERL